MQPCPEFDVCGLCTHLPLGPVASLEQKQETVEKALGLQVSAVESPLAVGYRARVTLRGVVDGWGYRKPRTHTDFAVERCVIARPEIQAVHLKLPPGPSRVELRSDGRDVVVVVLEERPPKKEWVESVLALDGVVGVAFRKRTWGRSKLEPSHPGLWVGPNTFFQVNLEVNHLLVDQVTTWLTALAPNTILDLYGGCGNLTLPMMRNKTPVHVVEANKAALADLASVVKAEGLPCEQTRKPTERVQPGDVFFDVAVLDPPRAGARGVLRNLVVTRPRAMVYISCDRQSLKRDLRELDGTGYAIREAVIFDMFPHTEHIETAVLLERE